MNPIIQIYPNCSKHTSIVLDKNNVHIKCTCGNSSKMNVKQIIN